MYHEPNSLRYFDLLDFMTLVFYRLLYLHQGFRISIADFQISDNIVNQIQLPHLSYSNRYIGALSRMDAARTDWLFLRISMCWYTANGMLRTCFF